MTRETIEQIVARHKRESRADQRKLLIAIAVSLAVVVLGTVMLGSQASWADAIAGLGLAGVAALFGLVVGMVGR